MKLSKRSCSPHVEVAIQGACLTHIVWVIVRIASLEHVLCREVLAFLDNRFGSELVHSCRFLIGHRLSWLLRPKLGHFSA
jgi:hypothetical protein